ncbi:2-dehydro-3-deoxyphosphoheptonate aldolase [Thermococcus onnurineus NA1]|uniref:2-dehydro-3-deoxyphosphoheptonate aldolase n=1 Tax=Thermococcus onnurineus (strain NA1) TaxID=523850 RepID=B6YX08_THEON|nr:MULTISPECIES: 3-deoxy-7-phosphoheptulonate synthase [Thermococcus]ACJ16621.1 2-dehydro-3-deoxyphosphoheptonate aldolase [Thermococcus onnurineus NA1]NJE47460.1 3-deoxy-7-phosphoheptulonate synthase [Thermococcus sp. GR7]NJE78612.1 3-deoxy-7-phosphoheptulonate synthase [Thermococcus sp. GR4]NJF23510.1 3-deoxy-7-phosphoheptulonate synthase [Thermococcus sp. GR5]
MSPEFKFSKEYKSRTVIKVGDVRIGDGFTIIAGPCAVESEEQITKVAEFLAEVGVKVIRGGAFKPRTSPYSFQGYGERALKWLRKAADEYGLVTVTEVMDTSQVELVAKYSDIVQIGARNAQNFELLKAVGKIDNPVLLKRGMGNTVQELLHSAEYIMSGGNENVILCERGIRTFETATRFTLDISVVPVIKELSHLPAIVDPSHPAGRRSLVIPLAKAAYAVGADGIMVEVHPEPEKALSDSAQQLDFEGFRKLLEELEGLGWRD